MGLTCDFWAENVKKTDKWQQRYEISLHSILIEDMKHTRASLYSRRNRLAYILDRLHLP
jgi:hypothetical protein